MSLACFTTIMPFARNYQGKCSLSLTANDLGGTFHTVMIPRIVITGAPGSGKTEVLKRLQRHSAFSRFVFLDELARRLLSENPEHRENWSKFHVDIYHRQVEREKLVGSQPLITDRGTVDAFAFHPQAIDSIKTTIEKEYRRYSAVVQLGSSAILGNRYYQRDRIRLESAHEALAIEKALVRVWRGHPEYHFIKACVHFEKKYDTCLQLIRSLL